MSNDTEFNAPTTTHSSLRPKVYVDGVFDLFHVGHVEMLRRAAEIAHSTECELLVGVISDEAAASYKRVPVMTLAERSAVIASCRYVDKFLSPGPLFLDEAFLNKENICLVLHGDDAAFSDVYSEPLRRGVMRYLPYTPGISTSDIISRVRHLQMKETDSRRSRSREPSPHET
jgi:ethanolamine-phosphate cytidylyltransferase